MELQELGDRMEIQAALTRYATSVDSRDWERWQSVFTPDADVDYSQSLPLRGTPVEVSAFFEAAFADVPWMQHYITNVDITFTGADTAKVDAMFYNPCLLPGMTDKSVFGGYYHHEFLRTADGWKSRHLVEQMLWAENRPEGMGG
ncbi:MAG TPA: nuclear transport factor 2 family protein [Nocardioides sp.]|nr:nuclear transport factor 2 family protein [Nocardioides sp.]